MDAGEEPPRRWRLVRARTEPASVRRFLARARRRRLNTARPWLFVGAVLLVAALLVWGVYGTPLLSVGEVRIVGVKILTVAQVRAVAGIADGTPLARLDTVGAERRIARLAPVDRVDVSRSWPSTVTVTVTERRPVGAVPTEGGFVLIDPSGVPFQDVARQPAGLPQVKLVSPGSSDATTRAALRVLAALSPEIHGVLVALVADSLARIRLELAGGRSVIWGDAEFNEKKTRTATLLLARPGKVIDVSAPDFAVVR